MRATRRELLAQVGDVAHDLPAFLTAPLYRRWHRRWGATRDEITASLPGDALLPHAQFRSTRAITINAPPEAVWPWLVQVGCLRAGYYSNDLLDKSRRPEPLGAKSVLSFRDGVELLLQLAAEHTNANLPSGCQFMQYWDPINAKLGSDQLGQKESMSTQRGCRGLNPSGLTPPQAEVDGFRDAATNFFEDN